MKICVYNLFLMILFGVMAILFLVPNLLTGNGMMMLSGLSMAFGMLAVGFYEWKSRLIFNTNTEEIIYRSQHFSVYEIRSVKRIRMPRGWFEYQIILPDRTIRILDFGCYNMQYFRTFLEAHDIAIQEENHQWH